MFDTKSSFILSKLGIQRFQSQINNSNSDKVKKSNNHSKSENYHALSKLDIKVLLREINQSFADFLSKHNLDKKGKIFLSGRNSQHKNLIELIGKSLKIDVALISPVNNFAIKDFSYNPDEINQYSMSRIIGLGLSLLKNDYLEDNSLSICQSSLASPGGYEALYAF